MYVQVHGAASVLGLESEPDIINPKSGCIYIQVHGAAGVSADTPLANLYAEVRLNNSFFP